MSWIGRFRNQFRRDSLSSEIDEELAAHLEEAAERGRSPEEARRAMGNALLYRERSRDIRMLPWLDGIASDVQFGWRQIRKNRVASAAAVLSLALAMGSTAAAFRLVDAVLLRTLPVAEPQHLFSLATTNWIGLDGVPEDHDDFDYPTLRRYREVAGQRADLLLMGMNSRAFAVFGSGGGEPVYRQFVSGNVFPSFGMKPALGRLIEPSDDAKSAAPVAVISHDFWARRFGSDPQVIGRTFRMPGHVFEIVGVAPQGFTGTEPGIVTDVFLPSMMNDAPFEQRGFSWFQIWLRTKPGNTPEQIRQLLQADLMRDHQAQLKRLSADTPKRIIDAYMSQMVKLNPAAAGSSALQRNFRRPLLILSGLVALVLLIACANVGNLLAAQATGRAREMALRVSIGAGRRRLIQLVLVESALLAIIASAVGALFAWWSAPLIVSMLAPPEEPVRLILSADVRAIGFGVALTVLVIFLFGLAPALRASSVQPMSVLKGGQDPHAGRRLMRSLIAAQTAFCVLVLFIAGLFLTTFVRLATRPLGFTPDHLLLVVTGGVGPRASDSDRAAGAAAQVADRLREVPGVESVASAGWPLLSGNRWTGTVLVGGRRVESREPYFLEVSPEFFDTMRIGWMEGRGFRPGDAGPGLGKQNQPVGGVGIVNETFAREFFGGRSPVGQTMERVIQVNAGRDITAPLEIIGVVKDAVYGSVRERIPPTVYFPAGRDPGAFIIRTSGDPLTLAPTLRRVISDTHVLQVAGVRTQDSLVRNQMIRDQLLATLASFFAIVALVLAAVGLYGVLNYSVVRQTREIGIRLALGARATHVVRRTASGALGMVLIGLAVGLVAGLALGRLVESLLFEVKITDLSSIGGPIMALLAAAAIAALPPAIRAVRIDPAETLRSE